MIEKFIADQGKYPENIGMVLWSGPNMRSSGQDIAEFLYMLGIRPVWQKGSLKVSDLEVIPLRAEAAQDRCYRSYQRPFPRHPAPAGRTDG